MSYFLCISLLCMMLLLGNFNPNGDMKSAEQKSSSSSEKESADAVTVSDTPSKPLPDQISFFSGNPSVEIIHGIMHLYKTK